MTTLIKEYASKKPTSIDAMNGSLTRRGRADQEAGRGGKGIVADDVSQKDDGEDMNWREKQGSNP
jgi:hypothetical protein